MLRISNINRRNYIDMGHGVGVESQCAACNRGEPAAMVGRVMSHSVRNHRDRAVEGEFFRCLNWDSEGRHIGEPFGFITLALKPVRCRNGRWRWLRLVERHSDGTFTLSRVKS